MGSEFIFAWRVRRSGAGYRPLGGPIQAQVAPGAKRFGAGLRRLLCAPKPALAPAPYAEAALTALLVFSCFTFGDLSKERVIRPWGVPVLVGCLIFFINFTFGHLGVCINPAIAAAPRLVAALLGGWGIAALRGASSYVLASLAGGFLGMRLFRKVTGNKAYERACSWICAEGPR